MDFRFDEDERDIIEQAGRTLARQLSPRMLLDGDRIAGWRAVGQDGWLHAGLDEELGGAGLALCMLAAVGRSAGRVLAGDGFVNNGVILPELLAQGGAADALADVLEHPGFLLLDGRSERLADAGAGASAEHEIPWCYGVERGMAAYELGDDGVLARYASDAWTVDPVGELALGVGAVRVGTGARPEVRFPTGPASEELLRRALVVHAAALVGLGELALEDTVAYVKEREQFGEPIGRFQAIKHGLADVAVALQIAWNAVLYASLSCEEVSVSIAHLQAVDAVDVAVRTMIQFFGGIAMTWEHHAHLYVKSAQTGVHRFGEADEHARRIAVDLLEGVA